MYLILTYIVNYFILSMVLRPVHGNITKVKTAKRIRKSTQNTDNNYVFPIALEIKVENAIAGLRPFFLKVLRNISNGNALTIADYILTMKTETNLSDNYRKETIIALCKLLLTK